MAALREKLGAIFPPAREAEIAHAWSGVLGVARDWCVTVGADRRHGLAWAGGYVGEGVAAANLAGRTLRDLLLDVDSPITRSPWVGGAPRSWEPEPLRGRASGALCAVSPCRQRGAAPRATLPGGGGARCSHRARLTNSIDGHGLPTLIYERNDRVARITFNRPEHLDTIVPPMPDELQEAVEQAVADEQVRVIVLRGAGRAFCAGFDFGEGFHHWDEMLTTDGRWDPGKDFIGATTASLGPVPKFMSLWRAPKPVIAQVHGWCVGGGSDMALCADLVIASEDARIGTPYSRAWGCYLSGMWLYRLGLTKAKEYALTGKPLSGLEAVEAGLINAAVPFSELEATVAREADRLAGLPRDSWRR